MTRERRRPLRFRLRTLLLLPLLVGAAWWWVSWPERTAKRFVQLLNDGDLEAAKAMIISQREGLDGPDSGEASSFDIFGAANEDDTTFEGSELRARTLGDVLYGQGSFAISKANSMDNQHLHFGGYRIERGRIRPPVQSDSSMQITMYRTQANAQEVLGRLRDSSPDEVMQIIEANGSLLVRTTEQGQGELMELLKSVDKPAKQTN